MSEATARDATAFADAIVVGAGSSSRMGGVDKLSAIVGGVPLLAYSLRAIGAAPEVRRIVIVSGADRIDAIGSAPWLPHAGALLVTGGSRRQESVWRGFQHALRNPPEDGSDPEVVLVHDGARPLVSTELVSAIAQTARLHGAAIPVLPVGDTIKRLEPDGTVAGAGDRAALGAAQTPQGIRTDLLRDAFAAFPADGPTLFTDEAALLEACRIPVHAIPGDERNFKVTVPADLARVELALGSPAAAAARGARVGVGSDSHPFGPGSGLALGGIVIGAAPRLFGHSDGDVLLHAIADGLLGACGLGDLGTIFPAGPTTPAGIASAQLVTEVRRRIEAAGLRVVGIDATVVAARPRLGAHLPAMRDRIAELLGVEPGVVNIKASTGNLDGMEGAGRGISALAIVVLRS